MVRGRPRFIPRAYDADGPVNPDMFPSLDPTPDMIVLAKQVLLKAQVYLSMEDYWSVILAIAGFSQEEITDRVNRHFYVSREISRSTVCRRLQAALHELRGHVDLGLEETRAYLYLALQHSYWLDLIPAHTSSIVWTGVGSRWN